MTETTYTVPGAPRLALLSDLHGRPYREIIVSASLSNTVSPIPRLKESSPAYHSLTGQEECHVVAFGTKEESVPVDAAEYLTDLQQYAGRVFDEPETAEVFQLIMTFLKYAVEEKSLIKPQVN